MSLKTFGLVVLLPLLVFSGFPGSAYGSTLEGTVLHAGLIGGKAKACGYATHRLVTAIQDAFFHDGLGTFESHRLMHAFTYAFNVGLEQQLRAHRRNCSRLPKLLDHVISKFSPGANGTGNAEQP